MMKTLRYFFVAALAMIGMSVNAQEVTIDFSGDVDNWGIGTEQVKEAKSYTYNGLTITLTPSDGNYFRWYTSGNILLGKQGATLTLPAFDFDVEQIQIQGTSGASAAVKQNIFVGDEAVSTETTGAKDVTNIYEIAEGKQAAGTIYTLKVTSAHNTQITKIMIYKKGAAPEPPAIQEVNVAQALDVINALADGATTSEQYKVTGYIVGAPDFQRNAETGALYGNVNLTIADAAGGSPLLTVYRAKNIGNVNFTEETIGTIKDGDQVVIQGQLQKYVSGETVTPEIKNCYLISVTPAPAEATVWDFTVLPTQVIDKTGNLDTNCAEGKFVEDGGAAWQIAYNKADFADGQELTASEGTPFETTKHLVFSAMSNKQTVIYRNYPPDFGGKYLFLNRACEFMIPAKAGQTISLDLATTNGGGATKKITSQDVVETFDDGGTPTNGIKAELDQYNYKTFTLTAKVENVYLAFEGNVCIGKITVKDGGGTGIAAVKAANKFAGTQMYNLAGQKVGKDYKGIVIVNGKKMLNK